MLHMHLALATRACDGFTPFHPLARMMAALPCFQPLPPSHARLLCKFNLHQLVCRLVPQAALRGHSSNYTELWGENYVQYLKSSTKYRSTSAPELVIIKTLSVDASVAALSLQHPALTLTFDQLVPSYRAGGMRGCNLDEPAVRAAAGAAAGTPADAAVGAAGGAPADSAVGAVGEARAAGVMGGAATGIAAGADGEVEGPVSGQGETADENDADEPQLLGSGIALQGAELERVRASLLARLQDTKIGWPSLPGWHTVWASSASAFKYQHADLGWGGFSIKSVAYTRAWKRVSYFAIARYAEGSGLVPYIAKVHFFAKLCPASEGQARAAANAAAERAHMLHPTPLSHPAVGKSQSDRGERGGGRRGRNKKHRRREADAVWEAAENAAQAAEIAANGMPPAALRVAFCDLYKVATQDSWRGTAYYVHNLQAPWLTGLCLPLDELSEKVTVAAPCFAGGVPSANQRGHAREAAWFMPFENVSNTVSL